MAGEGSEHERLERLADGSGVTLLGVRRDVLELIRGADALCLPSEAEALPMSILEAMALERPVVATDVGGTAEQVVDGETGHLVPAGDPEPVRLALLALAADPQRASEMGAAGRRRQRERFSGELMVDRYERVLSEAVERGRGLTSCWCRSAPRSAGAWPTRCCSSSSRRAGASTAVVSVGRGAADRLRRGYPLNDIVEMHAARRTVRTAVERHEPRALILSTTTAAMLLPRLPVPYAVRFDSPARLNRPGARNAPLHALERRAMRRARITIPYSVAGAEALPADAARAIVVSPPIDALGLRMTAWNVLSAGEWPWRTCPIRRRRALTCSWPAGRPQPCPTHGSRSTGSNRSGRARTSSEAACLSRRAST